MAERTTAFAMWKLSDIGTAESVVRLAARTSREESAEIWVPEFVQPREVLGELPVRRIACETEFEFRNAVTRASDAALIFFPSSVDSLVAWEPVRAAMDRWTAQRVAIGCVGAEQRSPDAVDVRFGSWIREDTSPLAVLWKRQALLSIGGYDLEYERFGEDRWLAEVDAQRRAGRAGWFIGGVGVPDLPEAPRPRTAPALARLLGKQLGLLAVPLVLANAGGELQSRPGARSIVSIAREALRAARHRL